MLAATWSTTLNGSIWLLVDWQSALRWGLSKTATMEIRFRCPCISMWSLMESRPSRDGHLSGGLQLPLEKTLDPDQWHQPWAITKFPSYPCISHALTVENRSEQGATSSSSQHTSSFSCRYENTGYIEASGSNIPYWSNVYIVCKIETMVNPNYCPGVFVFHWLGRSR